MTTSEIRDMILIDLAQLDKAHTFELGRLLAETDATVQSEFSIEPDKQQLVDLHDEELANMGFNKGINYERERILRLLDHNADKGPVNWLISKIKEN